jgi:hypothetical protein
MEIYLRVLCLNALFSTQPKMNRFSQKMNQAQPKNEPGASQK